MSDHKFSWEKYYKTPIIGILRGYPVEVLLDLIPVYIDSGYHTLEITMNSPSAAKTISILTETFPGLNIGAGTVCHADDLREALDAGAQFIVMPVLNEEVVSLCARDDVPVFPGAYTPTEIYSAWQMGASAVKVFPASLLGPTYIREVLAPLNDIKLLPTGGVSAGNIRSYFEAGAVGVGMGSSLFEKNLIEEKDWDALKTHFTKIKEQVPSNINR